MTKNILAFALSLITVGTFAQTNDQITIKTDSPIAAIQPTMWGVFFEDINFGADGGIYAEMVKNRSFEFAKPLAGWRTAGKKISMGDLLVINRKQTNAANPRFLRVNVNNAKKGEAGIINEGFRGMGIKKGLEYEFTMMYSQLPGGMTIHLELTDEKKNVIGETRFKPSKTGADWQKESVKFNATNTAQKANLTIWFEGNGQINLDMISLFPKDTWKGRSQGMRADMIQMLADMKPGFIRFPGGCIVEGIDLENRYQWKKTIGPIEERQLSGMACQFNTAEVVPLDQLDPYIQDAIDLIEFANGDVSTPWGKKRAEMGHAKPFNLKYLGVGNENWGPQYIERAKLFQTALKAKHPEVKLIFSSGTDPDSEGFRYLDKSLRSMNADVIDEHYYRSPEWFLSNANRYDNYDRNGSKVFAGEYAAHIPGNATGANKNVWGAALAEAAFMTGLERNAAVVNMASYAPLFANTDAWQWAPDLIWVDNLKVYGTPNYFVQKLFSSNKGTHVLSALTDSKVISGQDSVYASAVRDEKLKSIIIKVVNTSSIAKVKDIAFDGLQKLGKEVKVVTIEGKPAEKNSFDTPSVISPKESKAKISGKKMKVELAPHSFTLLNISYSK
ncbi:MAG: alpha-L-arabinofuranosidase [Pedobacter sp.]|nr:MAG: alpha-L-arabinofuranosidase [Pedobacter sp.]